MNKFLFFIFTSLLVSCKVKPVITDIDVNRVELTNSNNRVDYEYKKKLSKSDIKYFARKLKAKENEIDTDKLYIFIKSWEETTYKLGGVNKNGIDCSALMQELFKYVYSINLPRTSGEMYEDNRFKQIKDGEELIEGDLVFFKMDKDNNKTVSHVGIYLMNNYFFSASSTEGCNISSLKKKYWKKHYVGAVR
jgi:cell wall-associated NlpC family hydrolase